MAKKPTGTSHPEQEPADSADRPSLKDMVASEHHLYELLVHSIRDYAIFLLDPNGNIRTWNAGAERIKGYKPEEILGRHFSIFYPVEALLAGRPEYLLGLAATNGSSEDEGWRLRKNGERFWAGIVITALHDSDGRVIGYAKVTRDLTERKLAEAQRDELYEQERLARVEAETAISQLRRVQSITETALLHLDLDEMLGDLLDKVREILGADTAAVLLKEPDSKWLKARAAKGVEEEVEQNVRIPLGRGFAGTIAATRKPLILEDVEHSLVLNPILREKGVRSLLGVPLLSKGKVTWRTARWQSATTHLHGVGSPVLANCGRPCCPGHRPCHSRGGCPSGHPKGGCS